RVKMEKIGAFDNAWTWFDVTYYHPVTFSSKFEDLASIQAERFLALDFPERIYRTEAGAVLGEYRRNASNPGMRMDEVLSDLAYGSAHGYGHTTMGYLDDVKTMPETYKAGVAFYDTYYRPNNAVVIVAGDVEVDATFALIERTHGAWKPKEIPKQPGPAPVAGPKRGHVDWDSPVAPQIAYAFRVPACRPGTKEAAIIAVASELISGRTSPLFKKLRYEKESVTAMSTSRMSAEGFDERMLETTVRVNKERYDKEGKALLDAIEADLAEGFEELAAFSKREGAEKLLASIRSKYRYDLLAELSSPHEISGVFSWYYRFDRDPKVLDKIVEAVGSLTPADVDAFAAKYFLPERRVVVTMTQKATQSGEEK
ncbi:MAG: pitrilysin family protein, partial [Planctomycetota bacterium]